ncbi:MAG: permease [Fervidobacterium sp.]|jgi:uncharacterized membrane protein YraQ (UPF0718 family)
MKEFVIVIIIFLVFYFVPFDNPSVSNAILNGFRMLNDYARQHVLLCLVPAFFIAGTISILIKKDAVLKLLGPDARRLVSYPIAAISGAVLAVCSCTILPLFGGIYKKGAGIGPATTFLFAGPAINIAAIFLTARVLGWDLGIARMISTLVAAILIGLVMEILYQEKGSGGFVIDEASNDNLKSVVFFLLQLAFLIVSGLKINPVAKNSAMVILAGGTFVMALTAFERNETKAWLEETWDFAKKILPYLFVGVFLAGIITKLLPEQIITALLGHNNILSTLIASIIGALMYFATLTEIPIVQALTQLGMAKGPTLALLMAGNSLSLPSMIVITRLLGKKKAFTYFGLVVLFSTLFGFIYGLI